MAVRPGARLGRGPDVEEQGAAGLGQLVQGNRHRVRRIAARVEVVIERWQAAEAAEAA